MIDEMRRQLRDAHIAMLEPTHWTMHHEAFERLVAEASPMWMRTTEKPALGEGEVLGYPIFYDHTLEAGKFELRTEPVGDRLREAQIREETWQLQRRYQEAIEPLQKELGEIRERRRAADLLKAS